MINVVIEKDSMMCIAKMKREKNVCSWFLGKNTSSTK
jgi:hypothetical protein